MEIIDDLSNSWTVIVRYPCDLKRHIYKAASWNTFVPVAINKANSMKSATADYTSRLNNKDKDINSGLDIILDPWALLAQDVCNT